MHLWALISVTTYLCNYMSFMYATHTHTHLHNLVTEVFDYHGHPLHKWWVSRKLTITIATLVLILPWMYFKRIGVLGYTRYPVGWPLMLIAWSPEASSQSYISVSLQYCAVYTSQRR